MIDIKIPAVGESISEVTLLKWTKQNGEYVERDEVIAEVESEKATFEVNAEQAGVLQTLAAAGDTLNIGDVFAKIDDTAEKPVVSSEKLVDSKEETKVAKQETKNEKQETTNEALRATPVASAIITDKKVDTKTIEPSGVNGKVEIRPMMYLALSYDHRIIDGRESVSFLVRVKELLENPALLLMGKDPVKILLELKNF